MLACATMLCTSAAISQQEKNLYCFTPDNGTYPYAGMTEVNGILYGTTVTGGTGGCSSYVYNSPGGCGTVFSYNPATNEEKVVHSFTSNGYQSDGDGELPYGGLTYANGMLYGTTTSGGSGDCDYDFYSQEYEGCGTVYSINPSTGAETVLYSFQRNGTDGVYPMSTPIFVKRKGGQLFGLTSEGGTGGTCYESPGCGTIFKLDLATGEEKVVHSFQNNGTDGVHPTGDWTSLAGVLYSTTFSGGAYGYGTAFSFDPATDKETTLHAFGSGTDGAYPSAGMTETGGLLYGTTANGGAAGLGTVFSLAPASGTETVVHSFQGDDGSDPQADLISSKGLLYGTTYGSTVNGDGIVFSFDPKTNVETVLYTDDWADSENNYLTMVKGTLYGTVSAETNCAFYGGIYSVTP